MQLKRFQTLTTLHYLNRLRQARQWIIAWSDLDQIQQGLNEKQVLVFETSDDSLLIWNAEAIP